MEALVSIIVPVYNLEGYVDNCLNSLVNQTYQNIEILCIDDGSTDKSAEVIKSFAEKDSRIIYVYKENGGVSSARNLGLDMFKGDYVMFVDGDDYLHPQAVEILLYPILESNTSISCGNLEIAFDNTELKAISEHNSEIIQTDALMLTDRIFGLMSACGKLYSKECLSNIRFNEELIYSEDTVFLFEILLDYDSIAVTDAGVYYYFHRQGSATRTEFKVKKKNTLPVFDSVCDKLAEADKHKMLEQMLVYMFKFILTVRTQCFGLNCFDELNKVCKKVGKKWIKKVVFSDNIDKKTKIQFWVFFYSRHLYELARLIQDPTMLDFYKNRRKQKGKSQKD